MSWQTRSDLEEEVLDAFDEKLEDADLSEGVVTVIRESMEETTISPSSDADEEIAERLIQEVADGTD